MLANTDFIRGAVSYSALSVYGALFACCLCWFGFVSFYNADNLRQGGRSVYIDSTDEYGNASVFGERLRDVPGQGPLLLYAGASMARSALSSPQDLAEMLSADIGSLDLRAISVGGLSLWEIEALAANLDPARERILLLPMSFGRFQFAQAKLEQVAKEKQLMFSDASHWKRILQDEGIETSASFGFMALDNFAYVVKRKAGLFQQIWMPPEPAWSWRLPKYPGDLIELKKMWLDPTYKLPREAMYRPSEGPGKVISMPGTRVMAGWIGGSKVRRYFRNADAAEKMVVRSISRLREKGVSVVMFETPVDVEAMERLRGEENHKALLDDFYARVERISGETGSPVILAGSLAQFPTTKFSDWMHIQEDEARAKFTRILAQELLRWHSPSISGGGRE